MALHPVIEAALASAQGQVPYYALPLDQARAKARSAYPPIAVPVPVSAVKDASTTGTAHPIPLRVYTPPGSGPHPVLMFFHGSGFVLLDLDTHDDICRRLCVGAQCVVVSVDYRLAPEHRFPAGPDDCLAATRWVASHSPELGVDASRMAVAGDSAGGCLAAVTALRIRDEGGPALCAQLMFYPVTDYPSDDRASYQAFASGYGLTREGMQWFWDQYLGDPALATHPHAAPHQAASAAGLPPAYVVTAEYDVLRDEGETYAEMLQQSGVPVVALRGSGLNHGFLKYAHTISEVNATIAAACAWLQARWPARLISAASMPSTPC